MYFSFCFALVPGVCLKTINILYMIGLGSSRRSLDKDACSCLVHIISLLTSFFFFTLAYKLLGGSSVLIWMATIKKKINNRCWRGWGETRALVRCWRECKMAQPRGKRYGASSQGEIQNYHLVPQFRIWITPQRSERKASHRHLYTHVHSSINRNSQMMKAIQASIHR